MYCHIHRLFLCSEKSSPPRNSSAREGGFYENFGDGKSDSDLMVLGMFKILREVRKMPLEAVRAIAVEIALLGANGISPSKKYNLKTMPNRRDIMGLEILAYYYVT